MKRPEDDEGGGDVRPGEERMAGKLLDLSSNRFKRTVITGSFICAACIRNAVRRKRVKIPAIALALLGGPPSEGTDSILPRAL